MSSNVVLDLKAIRERAEKAAEATGGEWILGGCSGRMITTPDGYVGDGFIADVDIKENADHIATANPQTVIALLDRIDKLTVAAKELLDAIPLGDEDTHDSCMCDVCPSNRGWTCLECPPVKLAELAGILYREPTNEE